MKLKIFAILAMSGAIQARYRPAVHFHAPHNGSVIQLPCLY
jgi:hypothetical protein